MPSRNVRGWFGLSVPSFATVARLGVLAVAASVVGAGCGSSSSNDSNSPFVGRWEIDSTSSSFTLNCPNTPGLMNASGAALWVELVFEPGVLTPISETSSICAPGLAFNASSTALTIANPDPYTNQPPECDLSLGTDANNNPTFLALQWNTLTFTLLSPMAGQAPKGLFAGSAMGQVLTDMGTGPMVTDTCTYQGAAGDIFHRMSK